METNSIDKSQENKLKPRKIINYLLGVLEAFLAFRLIFKILGANQESTFVSIIYTVSGVFVAPFKGIFRTASDKGLETRSVLEPAIIIAMIVYALIAYGVVKLIEIYVNPKDKGVE